MARLRLRIELNRGGLGVSLEKLSTLVHETHAFLNMLAKDVRIDVHRGEWIGFQFDSESLNFTAEFIGPASAGQVSAFNRAFDGVTSLRRGTIAQFARIAECIEGDELIGFGLYENDGDTEPGEWRCLSKRDALRIAEEMRALIQASGGEAEGESPLPAVSNGTDAARYFRSRHSRARLPAEHNRLDAVVSDVENRLVRLEKTVTGHDEALEVLHNRTNKTDETFGKLVRTVEDFCDRAGRRIEQLSAVSPETGIHDLAPAPGTPPLRAGQAPSGSYGIPEHPAAVNGQGPGRRSLQAAPGVDVSDMPSTPSGLRLLMAAGVLLLAVGSIVVFMRARTRSSTPPVVPGVEAALVTKEVPAPPVTPAAPAAAAPSAAPAAKTTIQVGASEPVWLAAVADDQRLFETILEGGETRTFEFTRNARLRVGNAGGLSVSVNGRQLPPLGPRGMVRIVLFNGDRARVISPD